MTPCVPFFQSIIDNRRKNGKKVSIFFTLLLTFTLKVTSQCVTPVATIAVQPGAVTCNGQSYNLVVSTATAGVAPYDVTLTGPGGTTTYNDIPVGGVITNFAAPVEKIWPSAPVLIPPTNEDASVTLGVKFSSAVSGFVKGVRFFSPDEAELTPGTYTGQLWSASGTLLANGTYTGITNNQWQELIFSSPVFISANTVYVASYHTSSNKYVGTAGGFSTSFSNGSLTAPDNLTAGGNGVYSYGATPAFPANSIGANYWVDVQFTPGSYSIELTGIKDANECASIGSLQTLSINTADCSVLPVNIVVTPSSSSIAEGQSFTVQVAADFTGNIIPSGIDSLGLHLAFDKTKLAVTSITEGPVAAGFGTKHIPIEGAPFTNTNASGQINYVASTIGSIPVSDFNILTITFQVLSGNGTTTAFTLRRDMPADETNAFRNNNTVLATVINSAIQINAAGCSTPEVTISVQGSSQVCSGQPFNLILSGSAAGSAPFDLTIAGPNGSQTYNDVPVGGVITGFTPVTEKLWPANPVIIPPTNEDASVTLGVRFSSTVSGYVKGVRFFSSDDAILPPGSYTGQLWSTSGSLLANGTFFNVSNSNWQELIFVTPVLITANTNYIASYHTSGNKYVGTAGGFTSAITNGSLIAADGVYAYGNTPAFPTSSVSANYWVDVLFAPNVFTFNLTAIRDNNGCTVNGNLQSVLVTPSACTGNSLPVTLTNLSASPKEQSVLLLWNTSSEINNSGFEVQRSKDGISWSVIGFVTGQGNSSAIIKYNFSDDQIAAGTRYYYRLKQIDIDKRFTYSPIVSVLLDAIEGFALEQNYPNPVRNETMIKFILPKKEIVKLSLFDLNGRLVKVLVNETKSQGTHIIPFQGGSLTKGIYFYKLQAGTFSSVRKMTVQ